MTTDATANPDDAAVAPEIRAKLPFPLQAEERVLLICRRHWLFLWRRVGFLALVGILPPVLVGWLLSWAGQYDGTVAQIFWIAAAIWMIYWAARAFFTWYRYNHDLWVITNQRIVDSVKPHPFSLKVSTADLVNLQDMTVDRSGILQTMFDFGDVVCVTASGSSDFRIPGIPDPRGVQAMVDRERDRERTRGR
jgi:hypothetical protein